MKQSAFWPPRWGLAGFSTALDLFKSGALVSAKQLQFELSQPFADALTLGAEIIIESFQAVTKLKIFDTRIDSVYSHKFPFWPGNGFVEWKDKDYPCLNE